MEEGGACPSLKGNGLMLGPRAPLFGKEQGEATSPQCHTLLTAVIVMQVRGTKAQKTNLNPDIESLPGQQTPPFRPR